MSYSQSQMINAAKSLSRNPLSIIALFIVLVYVFASLVITLTSSLNSNERLPLVYFLVLFPILVLIVFAWLVSNHSDKLYGPSDFRTDNSFIKFKQVSNLSFATAKSFSNPSDSDTNRIAEVVQKYDKPTDKWQKRILWVDDLPNNNIYERRTFEELGLKITLARSTNEALEAMEKQTFEVVISDMGRKEGPREGYVLLDTMRTTGNQIPLFIYASSNSLEHKQETQEHGGQGCTNNPIELYSLVTDTIFHPGSNE